MSNERALQASPEEKIKKKGLIESLKNLKGLYLSNINTGRQKGKLFPAKVLQQADKVWN